MLNHHLRVALAFAVVLTAGGHLCGQEEKRFVWPKDAWPTAKPEEVGLDANKLIKARDYAVTSGESGGSGYITRHGKLVLSWGDPHRRYDLKSTTKSIGVTALGLAISDGKIRLDDRASKHHAEFATPPASNRETGWVDDVTIRHLATQTAGFEKRGGYEKLVFAPGTKWHYSDGGPNWLAECVTLAYRRDVDDLMFERVFTPIGISREDLRWRANAYRPKEIAGVARREFGSGIHANVDAMARIGYLYLREGRWGDRQIIPSDFVDRARTTDDAVIGLPEHPGGIANELGNASDHYGLLWWNNADGSLEDVPRSAYWSWGLFDSLVVVFPDLDIVVARACAGKKWARTKESGHYDVLRPFLAPIAASVRVRSRGENDRHSRAPYPQSPVIERLTWAPKGTIARKAKGSDNWPLAWADDGNLYTAYGDGHGFSPRVGRKLSLGFAKVSGSPSEFRGENIRSPDESIGDGASGTKASGLLMVDGILYLWVRNAGNARLAWSTDYARTWTWSDWKFTQSFGCPTFLQFGKNYAGARDGFVYIYSQDSDSAYEPADRMVLARVPKERLGERRAYEFFVALAADGTPEWTTAIENRGAVFEHPRRCYRSGISYNAGIRRYLWCQTLPESEDSRGPRFQGGFGVYDAPEPWGPWTTAYFTEEWDVGPGETSRFPPKWTSDDGRKVHLVFSGNDAFSVRRGTIEVAR